MAAEVRASDAHREFVVERAAEYFRRPTRARTGRTFRYDLAILWRPDDPYAPSNERAIRRFIRAAQDFDIGCEIIGPGDAVRIAEVVDHPEAIIRCGNKVYQAEVFSRHGIACPRTLVVGPGAENEIERTVGYPCVIKKADSSFSLGVVRARSRDELIPALADLFEESELGVVQSWTPSEFDWRVGVLDRQPLFAARYHMARGHWQIARHDGGITRYGKVEAVALADAPPDVLDLAVRAASLFGDGLFGVDLKVVDGRPLVMEVNDNPNIDGGYEDAVDRSFIYTGLARYFRARLDRRGDGVADLSTDHRA